MELSSSKIKKLLIFSQKIAFLIFWEMELFRSLLKKLPQNSQGNIPCSKKFLKFWEMELFILFEEGTCKALKKLKNYFSLKMFYPHFGMTADQAIKKISHIPG